MPRDGDIPDAFDVHTVVVLRRPAVQRTSGLT